MSSSSITTDSCPICKNSLEDGEQVCQIRQKGADGINQASLQRKDDIVVSAGSKVHTTCRKRYTNPIDIKSHLNQESKSTGSVKRSARVSSGPFNSKTDCLFCGCSIVVGSLDYSYVKTDNFVKTILECCDDRSDNWSFIVKGRIEYYGCDLHAADCLYHHSCSGNFRSGRDIPLQFQSGPEVKRKKSGRPKNQDQEQAFLKMCSYLEMNDEEQLSISDLSNKMKEFLTEEDAVPYGNQYLKRRLKEQYGNAIYVAEGEGLNDIVTMREKTSQILRSYFMNNCQEGDKRIAEKRQSLKQQPDS